MEDEDLSRRAAGLWSHLQDFAMRSRRGVIDWVSPSVTAVLGYEPHELIGLRAADITHPDDLAGAMRTRALLVAVGVSHLRARVRHRDGSFRWMDIRSSAEPDDTGEHVMLSSWRDVTDDVEALEAAQRSSDEMRAVAERATDVVTRGNDDGVIEWVSPSIRAALGHDPLELVGVPFRSMVHPDHQADVAAAQERLRRGDTVAFEVPLAVAEGGWRWFAIRVEPARDRTGRVFRVATWRQVEPREEDAVGHASHATMLRRLPEPLIVLDAVRDEGGAVIDFAIAYVNEAAAAYLARPGVELIGARQLEVLTEPMAGDLFERFRWMLDRDDVVHVDAVPFDEPGRGRRRFDVSAVRIGDSVAYTFRDVTERAVALERTAASEANYRELAEALPDIVSRVRSGTFDFVSPAVTQALGWRPDELVGRNATSFIHPDDMTSVRAYRRDLMAGRAARLRVRVRTADDTYRWVEAHTVTTGDDPSVEVFTGSWRIVDDQVAAEAELRHRATRDALTGLVNRVTVLDYLHTVANRPARAGIEIAVIYADIDGFKQINDTYGHATGDDVLRTIASGFQAVLRRDDVVARLGGDEFLIVLLGVTSLEAATTIAHKLRAATASMPTQPRPTVSFGVTLHGRSETTEATIDRADRAMYQAKRTGGDRVVAS